MSIIFPKTGPFNAYDLTGRASGGGWTGQQEAFSDRLQIVTYPGGTGVPAQPAEWGLTRTYIGRCEWRVGDPPVAAGTNTAISRAEWTASGAALAEPGDTTTRPGDEWWLSFEVYFPSLVFNSGSAWNYILQVHGSGGSGQPFLTVTLDNTISPVHFSIRRVTGTVASPGLVLSRLVPASSGWHRFLLHIIWGSTSTGGGLTEAWVDDFTGIADLSVSGSNMASDDPTGFYLKQGWYSSTLSQNQLIWYAGMRIATTQAEVVGTPIVPGNPRLDSSPSINTGSLNFTLPELQLGKVRYGFPVFFSSYNGTTAGSKRMSGPISVPDQTSIDTIHLAHRGTSAGTQVIKAVVYSADGVGGEPGTLLIESQELSKTSPFGARWDSIVLSSPVLIPAGNIWIGTHAGPTTQIITYAVQTITGGLRYGSDTYPGAANPAGAMATDNLQMSMVIEGVVTSNLSGDTTLDSTPSLNSGAFARALAGNTLLDSAPNLDSGAFARSLAGNIILDSIPDLFSGAFARSLGGDVLLDSVPDLFSGDIFLLFLIVGDIRLNSTPTLNNGTVSLPEGLTGNLVLDSVPDLFTPGNLTRIIVGDAILNANPSIVSGTIAFSFDIDITGNILLSSPNVLNETGSVRRVRRSYIVARFQFDLLGLPTIFAGGQIESDPLIPQSIVGRYGLDPSGFPALPANGQIEADLFFP